MLVEPTAKSPQVARQGRLGRQSKLAGTPPPIASFNPPYDLDPAAPAAAPAMWPWPRVFPGL